MITAKIRNLATTLILTFTALAATAQDVNPPVVVTAKVDSASVVMGGRAKVHVEVLKNDGPGVYLDPVQTDGETKISTLSGAEVRQIEVDSTIPQQGRVQVNYTYLIQPFDVGPLTFGPFRYALPGGDTISSQTVTIKVLEPEIPQMMRDSLWINDMEGPLSVKGKWYDFIPDWWPWLLGALLLAGIAVLVFILYKRNGKSLLPRKTYLPPHQVALKRLASLRKQQVGAAMPPKTYYTELTDILRQYLGARFDIYAREMTSQQILEAMEANQQTAPYLTGIEQLLTTADFVKFAKQNPGQSENVHCFNIVLDFVEKTVPHEEPSKP